MEMLRSGYRITNHMAFIHPNHPTTLDSAWGRLIFLAQIWCRPSFDEVAGHALRLGATEKQIDLIWSSYNG